MNKTEILRFSNELDLNGDGASEIFFGTDTGAPDGVSGVGYIYTLIGKETGAWAGPFDLSSIA